MLRLSARLDARGLLGYIGPSGRRFEARVAGTWLGDDTNIGWWTRSATPRRLARYVIARYVGEGFGNARTVAAQFAAIFAKRPGSPLRRELLDVFRRIARNG
jgi:hypothetical protein